MIDNRLVHPCVVKDEEGLREIDRRTLLRRGALASSLLGVGPLLAACGAGSAGGRQTGGGGSGASSGAKVIKFATVSPVNSFHQMAAVKFASLVKEKSNGAMTVQVFPAAQLGQEDQYLQGMLSGTPQMGYTSSTLATFYPAWGVVDFPYTFAKIEDGWRALDGPVGDQLRAGATQKGFHLFGTLLSSAREVAVAKPDITDFSDMAGVKLRVDNSPIFIDLMKAWHAVPSNIATTEIVPSMQTGVINGIEQPLDFLYTFGWYQQVHYVALTNHIYTSTTFVAGEKWFRGLSQDEQGVIRTAAAEAVSYGRPLALASLAKYRKLEENAGIKFNAVDITPFKAAADQASNKLAQSLGLSKQWNSLRSA